MAKSWTKSLQNVELAREAVIKGVRSFRYCGMQTDAALDRLAPFIGISRRRARGIFFGEVFAAMKDNERHHIRMGVVAAQRWLADYLREWADHFDRVADQDELTEKQLHLWGDDICQNDTMQERAA